MTSKLTRERLEKIKSWRETYGAGSNVMLPAEEAEELARIALAAMDSEPVAWTWHYREQWHVTNDKCRAEFVATDGDVAVLPLYRHAQSAPEKYNIGDATMRHIFTPTGMTNVSDMQAVFDRVEAVLVGMEQPVPVVPVVPVTDAMAYAFHHALTDSPLGDDDLEDIKAGLRAALVNGFNSQPAPVVPEEITSASAPEVFEIAAEAERLGLRGTYAPYAVGWNACRAAMLNGGNS
ncbi:MULTISPECIES: hypothetical protein [Klebsiella pneumoniae complex]|uniref:hypothetical protein n=1 Tax=Klebsiella pneumoniae complex TaxID=3390273 RepID=UPI001CD8094E|nr:hypothetical protein [Klebsiella pneumoniae]MCS5811179.1 hypothetical protein [Klebsiella pneumoniae subsp. pneumoniae]